MRASTSLLFALVLALYLTPLSEGQTISSGTPTSTSASHQVGLRARPAIPVGPDYRIGPGDMLHVSVFEAPQFTADTVVRPDGKISIPLLSDIPLTGLKPEDAQQRLTERLTKFMKEPLVTLIVVEIHSRIVYITGEVQRPGAYPLLGTMNVLQLMTRAGGPTEFAKTKNVYVMHEAGGPHAKVNYNLILSGKRPEDNLSLIPGDTVVVP